MISKTALIHKKYGYEKIIKNKEDNLIPQEAYTMILAGHNYHDKFLASK